MLPSNRSKNRQKRPSEPKPVKPRLDRKKRLALSGLPLVLLLFAAFHITPLVRAHFASLPEHEGEALIPQLEGNALLLRHEDGRLVIRAGSLEDAVRAVGFAHAQDRIVQLELVRRIGRGRLAEMAGERAIPFDRHLRTLDFVTSATRDWNALTPHSRALLQAYAEGINAHLAQHQGPWPLLLTVRDITPEPWTPIDSILWGKLTALRLARNRVHEERNIALQRTLGEDWRALYPWEPAAVRAVSDVSVPGTLGGGGGGTNLMIAAPHRSGSGAVLANDPHLDLHLPSSWYLLRLETPEAQLAGAVPVGLPLPLIGHSDRHAWGFTNHFADTQDLLVERLNPDNPNQYMTPEGPRDFDMRREIIAVHDGEPYEFTRRYGRFGPVVSDLLEPGSGGSDPSEGPDPGTVWTLAWPALDRADRTADAAFGLALARTMDDFIDAARLFGAPAQNLGYADTQGNIALFTIGQIPKRSAPSGFLPREVSADSRAWPEGMIAFDELPQFVNPASGLITNANDRTHGADYPYFMGEDWLSPSRAERFREVLEMHERIGVDAAMDAQLDVVSRGAQEILPLLLDAADATRARHEKAPEALAALADWDGSMDANRIEPLLYALWIRSLERDLLHPRLGDQTERAIGGGWNLRRLQWLLRPDSDWCPRSGCDALIALSLDHALAHLDELAEQHERATPFDLVWGDLHAALLTHPVLRQPNRWLPWWWRTVPTSGGEDTPNLALPQLSEPLFHHRIGPGLRFVVDLARPFEARFALAGGQSGHPASPHYDNWLEPWRQGAYIRLAWPENTPVKQFLLRPGRENQ